MIDFKRIISEIKGETLHVIIEMVIAKVVVWSITKIKPIASILAICFMVLVVYCSLGIDQIRAKVTSQKVDNLEKLKFLAVLYLCLFVKTDPTINFPRWRNF